MPKELERQLRKEAQQKFPGDKKHQDAYVWGTMQNAGLLSSNRKKGKKKK